MFKRTKPTRKSRFPLLALEIPTIIKDLAPAEVVKDSSAHLECQVTGTGPFEVTWYRDGKEVKSSAKHSLSQRNGTLGLDVHKCGAADVGEYGCTVANEVGSCSSKATLKLKGELEQASAFRFDPGLLTPSLVLHQNRRPLPRRLRTQTLFWAKWRRSSV